jgi:hypothetical protein
MVKNSGSAAIVGNLQLMGNSVSDNCHCMSYKQIDFEQFHINIEIHNYKYFNKTKRNE